MGRRRYRHARRCFSPSSSAGISISTPALPEMLVSGVPAGHGEMGAQQVRPPAAPTGPCSSASDFSRAMRSFPAPARISFSSAAIRFLSKSSGMCPFRRATPATASSRNRRTTARYGHSASGQAAVRAPATMAAAAQHGPGGNAAPVPLYGARPPSLARRKPEEGCSAPSRTGYSGNARTQQAEDALPPR